MQKAISKVVRRISALMSLISIFTGLALNSSLACSTKGPVKYDFFFRSDVVFRGKIKSYRPLEPKNMAQFQFEVLETLKGPPLKVWNVPWRNSTFGVPAVWSGPNDVVLALEASINKSGEPYIQILQDDCRLPSILEDTPENVRAVVRAAVK